MPATVHAGTQGRWHEQLCRILVERLRTVVRADGAALKSSALPSHGGVYCFWWTGDLQLLGGAECVRKVELAGPAGRPVLLELDDEWLGISTGLPLPLYVGKTADSISKRVGQHLRLRCIRMLPVFEGHQKQPRPTTSCQLRAGVEQLFSRTKDTRSLILDNVGLSWVELDGDQHAANRFYLEDLAVGLMRPPFNVDIER